METLLTKYAKYFAYSVLAISIFLMAYVIYEISQAKQRFAHQLITKSVIQTETNLDNFFDRVDHLIKAVEKQYGSGFWKSLPQEKTILHNISIIENYAPISSIGIADLRGYEFNVIPDTVEGQWLTREVFVDRWGFKEKWKRWRLDDSLYIIDSWEDTLEVDSRERPWFKGALKKKHSIFWTNPYKYTTGPEIGITASTLIPNENEVDSLSKIIAFDLTLSDLNKFVEGLELTKNQNIFLLTSDNSRVIALSNYNPGLSLTQLKSSLLVSPEKLDNASLLKVLNKDKNEEAFSFTANNETWWGVLRPYPITPHRVINIVSVLPERDFALEITRTLWVGIGSFFLILFLSFMVVRNHNKLHRIGNTLSDRNKLISKQKTFLFSEVHHRVKNNLALISAFIELEIMKTEHPISRNFLQQSLRRIKIIAIVQEEAYKADELGVVSSVDLVPSIIAYIQNRSEASLEIAQLDDFKVNVNQALSYGLLLNELLYGILNNEEFKPDQISIIVSQKSNKLFSTIKIPSSEALNKLVDEIIHQDIISAFVHQVSGTIESRKGNAISVDITFKLKNQKGTLGSQFYKS